jgi:hypothetical protein
MSTHVKDPGIYLYSFAYAEDTRAVGEDGDEDGGECDFTKAFNLALG